jgi:hypothetical protein
MEAEALKEAHSNGVGVGMVIAAAIIVRVWGGDVQAEEILGAAGIKTVADMRRFGVDAYDAWPLRNVIRQLSGRPMPLGLGHRRAA